MTCWSPSPLPIQAIERERTSSSSFFVTSSPALASRRRGCSLFNEWSARLPGGRLGFSDADLRYRVEPGAFTFTVGDLSETVSLAGDVAFPDRNTLTPVSCETTRG
jgi:hypothetical protein